MEAIHRFGACVRAPRHIDRHWSRCDSELRRASVQLRNFALWMMFLLGRQAMFGHAPPNQSTLDNGSAPAAFAH